MFKQCLHLVLTALTVFGAIGPAPFASVAHAASPNTLSYQGRLKDDSGVVVADGAYDFTFTLWTDDDAGTADWTEDQTLNVTDGYFSAQLGSDDPFLDGAGEETTFTVPLWLEIEVEGETLDPRIAVNSVAYSFSSRSIESFADEAAAEADAANFGGRMYYNTTNGNLYVYDSVGGDWVDTTGAGASLDDAYDNFGSDDAVVNVDNAEGQGDLTFFLDGANLVMLDSDAEAFVSFSDAGGTTFTGSLSANGVANIGDGGDVVAVNSSDWDITSSGNMSGIGTISADGAVTFTSTLAVTGNATLSADLAVNGDDITSDGDLTLTASGGQLLLADTNVFNVGGITGAAYNAISNSGGTADSVNVAADNDLYIQDDLEVDGTSVFDGNTDLNGTVTVNAVTTFNASPVFNSTLTADGAIEANGGITTQTGTALTINSGDTDAINIGNDTDDETIRIGTGAATKTIIVGNATAATVLNVDTGTGGFDVDLLGAMSIDGELVVIGGAADGNTATGDADLYVVGDFETDGVADFDGSFDFDGTTFDVDGSGLVSFTSTGASVTVSATDSGNANDDNVVLTVGNVAPNAGENGNDIALEAEDDLLATIADDVGFDVTGDFFLTANNQIDLQTLDNSVTIRASDGGNEGDKSVLLSAGNAAPDAGENGNDVAVEAEDDFLVETTDDIDFDVGDALRVNTVGLIDVTAATSLGLDAQAGDMILFATDAFNAGTYNVSIESGESAPDAGENGNDIAVQAEDDVLVEATDDFDVDAADMVVLTSGTIQLDTAGVLELNASAGAISIGNDAVAQAINVGTGAAARTITVGNATGATALNFDTGSGGFDVDLAGVMSLDGELVVVGGAADGELATGDADLYVVGDLETDGLSDFDGTATFSGGITSTAGEVLVSGGNVQLNDNVVLAFGTGNDFEIVHDGSNTSLSSITGNLTVDNSGGTVEINASAGAISIGNDAVAQAINVGTGAAARTITVGNATGATALNFDTGSGGFDVDLAGVMSLDGELVVVGGAADGNLADGDADLYVVGDFETDGAARFDGAVGLNSDVDATFAGTENMVISNTTGSVSVDVVSLQIANTDGTAATQRGLVITNASDATVSVTENLIALDNLDGDTLTDAILVGATGNVTDGIDVSAANIVNAVNAGTNVILGTAASIDFSEFDVSAATGSVTIDDGGNAGFLSVDATVLDIDSLGFVGAGQVLTAAGTALSLIGGDNGTQAGEDVIIDSENWNVNASGVIDSNGGLSVSAGDISLTDTAGTTWSISAVGVAQFGSSVTVAGTADGTDALTLTAGDVLVSNGDLDLSGGDFNVLLDSADSASITNATATTTSGALVVSNTTDATNAGNSAGLGVSATFTDYADDGVADNRQGMVITVTNNATDAGTDDNIYGLRIQNLAGANQADGGEFAIALGNTWDADLQLGNNETLSNQTDDLVKFAGSGGTNNTSISFDLDGTTVDNVPTLLSGTTLLALNDSLSIGIDGATTENITNPTFAFGAGNDLYVDDMLGVNGNIFADGQLTLQGTGDGNDSLVLTTGDILVTDGDFDMTGGDFNVALDAGDSASVSSAGSNTSFPTFAVSNTHTGSDNTDGMTVTHTLQNYADDGVADNRNGLSISVTNNASDAGVDDSINGILVNSLVGGQADGNEAAIKVNSGWDFEFVMSNNEALSNGTDDSIVLTGNGGTNNTSLTIDVDGAVNTVPTLVGGASDLVAVNDSLSVGVDGTTTENIGNTSFSISGGEDLYVEDDAGFDGDVYFDGMMSFGIEQSMSGATPSVSAGNHWRTNNGGATSITNFTNGTSGQVIFIRVGDNNTTLDCTGSNLNCGSTDITLATDDFATFFRDDPGNWQLVSLMDDSDNHNAGNGFDLAEWFPASEELSAGDVVSVDPDAAETVRKSQGAYESGVIGVVSTAPGLTLGEPAVGYASEIALAGRVPVNVTDENGAIQPGDYLTSSSVPGVAMKATEAGPVIGIAMDSLESGSGQVVAKLANFWYAPPQSGASSLQGSDGSVLSASALSVEQLVVAGDATFEGSVTVASHLYASADMAGRARISVGDTRVHVSFENEYASQPIVTATLRTATNIPGYWWVEEESTTGFDIVLDGTLTETVEFNWISLGVVAGRVSVSDGSSQDIGVYVLGAGASEPEEPAAEVPADESSVPAEEPAAEGVPAEEQPAETEAVPDEVVPAPEEVPAAPGEVPAEEPAAP